MIFKGIQKPLRYVQTNPGSREEIFPLLCPVPERDWIDGWEYEMIHSISGFAELGCVFTTPYKGDLKTIWQITQFDTDNYCIEFVRVTPGETIVKINIDLERIDRNKTETHISYQYTGLNEDQNQSIINSIPAAFTNNMIYWENAINHYLKTGNMLTKNTR